MLSCRISKTLIIAAALAVGALAAASTFGAESKSWNGIDEAVVEKIAKEHGRESHPPLIDPGDGDLLLFAFLAAGAVGGFAAGYYWRVLFKGKGE